MPIDARLFGILIGMEINKDLLSGFCGKLNGGNHIAVSRNDNGYVAILLIGVGYYLCGNPYICFLFFMGMDNVSTTETCYGFFQVFT